MPMHNCLEMRSHHRFAPSDQRFKLIVKIAIMVRVKACIRTLHFLPQPFIKWDSPLICSKSCLSFVMIVTLLAWIAHMLASSKSPMLKASTDSCIANNDVDWKQFASWCGNEPILFNPAVLLLQDVGMASCRKDSLCSFGNGRFGGEQQCQGDIGEASWSLQF